MWEKILRCSLVVLMGVLFGCASTAPGRDAGGDDDRADADYSWTEADQLALAELAAAPPPAPRSETPLPPLATAEPEDVTEDRLEIYVFSIGQADSMLVVGPSPDRKTLLVDLGEPIGDSLPSSLTSSSQHVLDRIKDITGREDVDYFVLSHYHSDHAGRGMRREEGWGTGIIGVLSDFSVPFSVGEFIHVGDDGAEFMKEEDRRGVYKTIKSRMPIWQQNDRVGDSQPPSFEPGQIALGPGVAVEILSFAGKVPDGPSAFERAAGAGVDYSAAPGNENDLSIALEISAGEFELFTGGDLNGTDDPVRRPLFVRRNFGSSSEIYTNIEHRVVDYWQSADPSLEGDVEVYRANHHGSGYSTTAKLLDALDPEFILYSAGAEYDHPNNTVVQRGALTARQLVTTAAKNPTVFANARGEVVGEIRITVDADGKGYIINGEHHRAFSDAEEASGDDEGEEDREP